MTESDWAPGGAAGPSAEEVGLGHKAKRGLAVEKDSAKAGPTTAKSAETGDGTPIRDAPAVAMGVATQVTPKKTVHELHLKRNPGAQRGLKSKWKKSKMQ